MADQERRVRVVGGGPAGLVAARLLKRAWPGWEVRLHERLPAEHTFGFGVGLSGRTLSAVERADPEVAADLVEAAWQFSTAEFRLPQGTAAIPGFHSGVAIGRATLLRVLARRAEAAGVKIERGSAPTGPELTAQADLVIAGDGVGSPVRPERGAGPQQLLLVRQPGATAWHRVHAGPHRARRVHRALLPVLR